MKLITKLLVLMIFMFIMLNSIQAQETRDLLSFYDSELVKVNYSMFGGISFSYQGKSYSPFFGLDNNFMEILKRDEEVKKCLEAYSTQNTIGHVLYWGGLIALMASPVIVYYSMSPGYSSSYDSNSFGNAMLTFTLVASGSTIVSLIGGIMIYGSLEMATNSMNLYNRNKIKEYN